MRKGAPRQPIPERPLGHHLKSREQSMLRKNTGIIPIQHCPELDHPLKPILQSPSSLEISIVSCPQVSFCVSLLSPQGAKSPNRRQNKGLMPHHAASLTCACENLHFPCLPQLDSHVLQHPLYLVTGIGQGVMLHIPGSPQLRSDF